MKIGHVKRAKRADGELVKGLWRNYERRDSLVVSRPCFSAPSASKASDGCNVPDKGVGFISTSSIAAIARKAVTLGLTLTFAMATTSVTSALAQPVASDPGTGQPAQQTIAIVASTVSQLGSASENTAQNAADSSSKAKKSKKKTKGEKAVALAKKQIGTPYVYAGSSPKTGFDCSGLMYYVYGKLGKKIPRTAQGQYNKAKTVSKKSMKPGDLVFFGSDTSSIYHVGMYVGDGKYIHSPQTGDTVKIAKLSERSNIVAAARV